ncbi:MAG: peptidylprolyl isomerase [Myxococcota bacterium]|nr:peptidylprolyl isomerase [Myxococcota bacterium]
MGARAAAERAAGRVRRILLAPVLHFLVVGAAAYALAPAPRPLVVITPAEVAALADAWTASARRPPSPAQRAALIEQAIDEAILLREAWASGLWDGDPVVERRLARVGAFVSPDAPGTEAGATAAARALGLDREDVVVRRYLVERMRLAIEGEADGRPPSESELARHLEAHPERFRLPERWRLHHVFASSRHGDALAARTRELGTKLAALDPDAAGGLGDPFPHGRELVGSAEALGRRLGPAFPDALDASATGRWQGPIPSAYGLHWVWVRERVPARTPALAEVRGQLRQNLLRERRAEHLRRRLAALRERYEIRIEDRQPGGLREDSAAVEAAGDR